MKGWIITIAIFGVFITYKLLKNYKALKLLVGLQLASIKLMIAEYKKIKK